MNQSFIQIKNQRPLKFMAFFPCQFQAFLLIAMIFNIIKQVSRQMQRLERLHHMFLAKLREIIILTAAFTLLVALTGGVLYGLGLHFWKRHRKELTSR